jgi:hypothetical protein
MWTTFAFVAALSLAPGQAGKLTLTNARPTYGLLGAPRADTKLLPGDSFTLSFDIEGIKSDAEGKVKYSIAMEVTDAAGKVQFKQDPRDLEVTNSLGGSTMPAAATLQIGLDQKPGKYNVKVTVTDLATKASESLTGSYEVLQPAFGLVRPTITHDSEGQHPAPIVSVGQSVWINFAAVGFDRDKDKKQPHLKVELTVVDENGKPTLAKPLVGEVKDEIPDKVRALPMQFVLSLNRAGKFTVQVKATDSVSGKTATLSGPLTVMQGK